MGTLGQPHLYMSSRAVLNFQVLANLGTGSFHLTYLLCRELLQVDMLLVPALLKRSFLPYVVNLSLVIYVWFSAVLPFIFCYFSRADTRLYANSHKVNEMPPETSSDWRLMLFRGQEYLIAAGISEC